MNDEDLRREYQRASRSAPPGPHPEPEELERIVNGEGSEAERLDVLDHVLQCPTCGPELDLLRTAAEGSRAAERRAPATRWLALAAAALLLVGIGTFTLRGRHNGIPSQDVMRGNADAIAVIEPAARSSFALPIHLAWHPVSGASTYRVELLSAKGDLVHAWTTRDTTLVIADSAQVSPGASYDVWVRATRADRTEISSPLVRFSAKR
jgi:hypothetical protein